MERRDYKKEKNFRFGPHDEATGTRDLSTTELSGTRAEADLIVKALETYVAVERLLRVHGVQFRSPLTHIYRDEQVAYAGDLLSQIQEPNYQEVEEEPSETERPFIREPLYQMVVNGEEFWLTMREAGIAYDSGVVPVSFGGLVLESPGKPRYMTDEEKHQISDIAEEWSASK